MSSLSDIRLPTAEIPVGGDQSLTVRGLSFSDLSDIWRDNADVLDKLYREHIVEREEMPPADELAKAVLAEAPRIVALIVAHANDEPEQSDVVSKLPGVTQIGALVEVARLTFHSEAEIKKLMETVTQGATTLNRLFGGIRDAALPSP